MSAIDDLLYRKLASGSQFEGLIPPFKAIDYKFDKEADNSTTYDTLNFMAQWTKKYAYQMQKVAPLLKGRTVDETVNNIYNFLYWHFQYKLDNNNQRIFAPSAAWYYRKNGFDCKSFSVLAACCLECLNIKNYSFRMVKQAQIMPGQWSHVYVVVGNKVIDATKTPNKEVSFTDKYDLVMNHSGLAVPFVGQENNRIANWNGLGCACDGKPTFNGLGYTNSRLGDPSGQELLEGAQLAARAAAGDPTALVQLTSKGLDAFTGSLSIEGIPLKDLINSPLKNGFTVLKSLFNKFSSLNRLKCLGGTAYNEGEANHTKADAEKWFTVQMTKINIAARLGKMDDLAKLTNEFFGVPTWCAILYDARTAEGFNVCTRDNLYAVSAYFGKYRDYFGAALNVWIQTYFDVTATGTTSLYTSRGPNNFKSIYGINWAETSQDINVNIPNFTYTPKKVDLKAFTATSYLINAMDQPYQLFNGSAYISSLETVIKPVPVTPVTPATPATPQNNNTPPPAKSGVSPIAIAAAGIAAKLLFFS